MDGTSTMDGTRPQFRMNLHSFYRILRLSKFGIDGTTTLTKGQGQQDLGHDDLHVLNAWRKWDSRESDISSSDAPKSVPECNEIGIPSGAYKKDKAWYQSSQQVHQEPLQNNFRATPMSGTTEIREGHDQEPLDMDEPSDLGTPSSASYAEAEEDNLSQADSSSSSSSGREEDDLSSESSSHCTSAEDTEHYNYLDEPMTTHQNLMDLVNKSRNLHGIPHLPAETQFSPELIATLLPILGQFNEVLKELNLAFRRLRKCSDDTDYHKKLYDESVSEEIAARTVMIEAWDVKLEQEYRFQEMNTFDKGRRAQGLQGVNAEVLLEERRKTDLAREIAAAGILKHMDPCQDYHRMKALLEEKVEMEKAALGQVDWWQKEVDKAQDEMVHEAHWHIQRIFGRHDSVVDSGANVPVHSESERTYAHEPVDNDRNFNDQRSYPIHVEEAPPTPMSSPTFCDEVIEVEHIEDINDKGGLMNRNSIIMQM
ncbi:hypothetical protein DFH27DRAFT_528519 [Peziza echinospora]|nr:hypothetical protein DFH27DRAFT_528519 [Peziza echinospora]